MQIYIDDREFLTKKQKRNYKYFEETFKKDTVNVTRLDVGDVIIKSEDFPDICIERKTIKDFAKSCISRHMQNQGIRMLKYDYRAIIIIGNFKTLANDFYLKKFSKTSFYSNYISLFIRYKIPIFMVETEKDYVKCINTIIKMFKNQKPLEQPMVINKSGNVELDMLTCISGIGKKKAELILKKFKNIYNIVMCDIDDLLSIKGIGIEQAKEIKKHLNR